MKTIACVASIPFFVFSLNGQVTATVSRLPDGSNRITIKNSTPKNVVAYAVSAGVRGGAYPPVFVYSDPAMTPLSPNEERQIQTVLLWCGNVRDVAAADALRKWQMRRQKDPASAQPNLICELEQPRSAAIMEDGSATGDQSLIVRLTLQRTNLLMAVETTLEILSDAGRRNIPRKQLIDEFTKMSDSLNRWYLLPEQKIGRDIYQSIAGKLTDLPEVAPGSAFPPGSFVAKESATLRQQRAALLESQPMLADAARIR